MAPSSGREPGREQGLPTFTAIEIQAWNEEKRRETCQRLAIPVERGEGSEALRRKLLQYLHHRSPPTAPDWSHETATPDAPRRPKPHLPEGTDESDDLTAQDSITDTAQPWPSCHQNGGNFEEVNLDEDGFQTPMRTAKPGSGHQPDSPNPAYSGIRLENQFDALADDEEIKA